MNESKRVRIFNKLSFFSVAGTLFLLPFFFLPTVPAPLEVTKGFILSIGVLLAFSFWLISRFFEGSFTLPRSILLLSALALPVTAFLSAVFSPARTLSIFGSTFELGTVISILFLSLLFFLVAVFAQDAKKVYRIVSLTILSFVITLILQIVLVFVDVPSFAPSFFVQLGTPSFFGLLSHTALFISFGVIVLLLAFEILPLPKWMKVSAILATLLSLFVLSIFNYSLAWILLGGSALLVFVYSMSIGRTVEIDSAENVRTQSKFPFFAFIVILISTLFIITQGSLGAYMSSKFGMNFSDVRPSVAATFDVARDSLMRDPVFGSGPGRFAQEWFLNKPVGINNTDFWSVSFAGGSGFVPTLLVTLGILGFLSWLAFIGLSLQQGSRLIAVVGADKLSRFLFFSSIMGATYFWVVAIFGMPNTTLLAYAFVFSGLVLGSLVQARRVGVIKAPFLNDPRKSFFMILLLVVIMIGAVVGLYSVTKKFVSVVYFNRAVVALNTEDNTTRGTQFIERAIRLSPNDALYRVHAEIRMAQINEILSNKSLSEDTIKSEFQNLFQSAENSARNAIAFDRANHVNWVALGKIYEAVVPLGVTGAYENAKMAYTEAQRLNPESPDILLNFAQLEVANKNNAGAKDYARLALEKKINYLSAYFFLSDLALVAKDTSGAIKELENASGVLPNSDSLFLKLGALRYDNSQYLGAVSAFERAVIINPNLAQSRFLLALAYQKTGRSDDARTQLQLLKEAFPESQDIQKGLDNLNAGRPIIETSGSSAETAGESIDVEEETAE